MVLVVKVVDVPSFIQMMAFGSPEKLAVQSVSMSLSVVFSDPAWRGTTEVARMGITAEVRMSRAAVRIVKFWGDVSCYRRIELERRNLCATRTSSVLRMLVLYSMLAVSSGVTSIPWRKKFALGAAPPCGLSV